MTVKKNCKNWFCISFTILWNHKVLCWVFFKLKPGAPCSTMLNMVMKYYHVQHCHLCNPKKYICKIDGWWKERLTWLFHGSVVNFIPAWLFFFKPARKRIKTIAKQTVNSLTTVKATVYYTLILYIYNEHCMVIISLLPPITLRVAVQTAFPYSLVAKHL